jgi:hypothetical protein
MTQTERKTEQTAFNINNTNTLSYSHDCDYSQSRIARLIKVAEMLDIPIAITQIASSGEVYTITSRTPDGANLISEDYSVPTNQNRIKLGVYGNHRLLFFGLQTLDECLDGNTFDENKFKLQIDTWEKQEESVLNTKTIIP